MTLLVGGLALGALASLGSLLDWLERRVAETGPNPPGIDPAAWEALDGRVYATRWALHYRRELERSRHEG